MNFILKINIFVITVLTLSCGAQESDSQTSNLIPVVELPSTPQETNLKWQLYVDFNYEHQQPVFIVSRKKILDAFAHPKLLGEFDDLFNARMLSVHLSEIYRNRDAYINIDKIKKTIDDISDLPNFHLSVSYSNHYYLEFVRVASSFFAMNGFGFSLDPVRLKDQSEEIKNANRKGKTDEDIKEEIEKMEGEIESSFDESSGEYRRVFSPRIYKYKINPSEDWLVEQQEKRNKEEQIDENNGNRGNEFKKQPLAEEAVQNTDPADTQKNQPAFHESENLGVNGENVNPSLVLDFIESMHLYSPNLVEEFRQKLIDRYRDRPKSIFEQVGKTFPYIIRVLFTKVITDEHVLAVVPVAMSPNEIISKPFDIAKRFGERSRVLGEAKASIREDYEIRIRVRP